LAIADEVRIIDQKWHIGSKVTNPNSASEGLLINVRMVNAVFEDRGKPDFDASANTDEFIEQIPSYVSHGVNAFTIGLQGGYPGYEGAVNSAFGPDGSLAPAYLARAQRVISACDQHGAVVILGCYYQRQDQVLRDEAALRRGISLVAKWLGTLPHRNVVLEIANEWGHGGFDHAMLQSAEGQVALIHVAKEANPALLVSTAGLGDGKSADLVANSADFLLIHFNNTKTEDYAARIDSLQKYRKPIVCNEDQKYGASGARAAAACVGAGASWGYMNDPVNQHFPFRFAGADDDREVYVALRHLTR
jgi:hypothetical protein